jgi:hypothetical protein
MQYYNLVEAYAGASEITENFKPGSNIKFIHIGKCGGTAVLAAFNMEKIKYSYEIHMKNTTYQPDYEKYIMWIRHPISRFVSAFMYNYAIHNTNVAELPYKLDTTNCICPEVLNPKRECMKKNEICYTWNKDFDFLVSYFKSPNDLAESLTSDDPQRKKYAYDLMQAGPEHIMRNINFYLFNGEFIEKYHDKFIFVGTMENMEKDLIKCGKIINKTPNLNVRPRTNDYDSSYKYFSKKGLQNIKNYLYKDYNCIKALYKYKLISKEVYDSYLTYKYIK